MLKWFIYLASILITKNKVETLWLSEEPGMKCIAVDAELIYPHQGYVKAALYCSYPLDAPPVYSLEFNDSTSRGARVEVCYD